MRSPATGYSTRPVEAPDSFRTWPRPSHGEQAHARVQPWGRPPAGPWGGWEQGVGERVGGHLAESGPGGIRRTHRVDQFAYFSPIFRDRPEVPDRLARKKASPRLSQRC